MSARRKTPGDIVVFVVRKDARCDECGRELGSGSLIRVVEGKSACLDCADLDHLAYLPSGDAALTRRAGKHSRLRAVVVRWSTARKRYERQGTLVEEAALEQASPLYDASSRCRAISILMSDWRGTPSRDASRSSESIIHDGKSTFTRRCAWPGRRALESWTDFPIPSSDPSQAIHPALPSSQRDRPSPPGHPERGPVRLARTCRLEACATTTPRYHTLRAPYRSAREVAC